MIKPSVRWFAIKISSSFSKVIPEYTLANQVSDNILPRIFPRISDICALKQGDREQRKRDQIPIGLE
jgi:hypothetical protein